MWSGSEPFCDRGRTLSMHIILFYNAPYHKLFLLAKVKRCINAVTTSVLVLGAEYYKKDFRAVVVYVKKWLLQIHNVTLMSKDN